LKVAVHCQFEEIGYISKAHPSGELTAGLPVPSVSFTDDVECVVVVDLAGGLAKVFAGHLDYPLRSGAVEGDA
jgi:hypothetical protein